MFIMISTFIKNVRHTFAFKVIILRNNNRNDAVKTTGNRQKKQKKTTTPKQNRSLKLCRASQSRCYEVHDTTSENNNACRTTHSYIIPTEYSIFLGINSISVAKELNTFFLPLLLT